ncbi:hypothetical protein GDN83_19550 [Gordonia jinghuaiqii]|nr:hypothetical protein [Gordonia jinghuaiqii]
MSRGSTSDGSPSGSGDDAFARWDSSRQSLFTLDDGRLVADAAFGAELAVGVGGSISPDQRTLTSVTGCCTGMSRDSGDRRHY